MNLTLKEKLLQKQNGVLLYGLTPPKTITEAEKVTTIAQKQIDRIKDLPIDGLVLYDIQDESSRTNIPRPFPFMPTFAPDEYSNQYLSGLDVPKIIYKSVGKYTPEGFNQWIEENSKSIECSVFVGSPSKDQVTSLSLQDAYKINANAENPVTLGGVTIPERHSAKGNEHIRLFNKVDNGCSFFISQCVYSINNSKDFLSDYYYHSQETGKEIVPIIFTLTPCGSVKTLQFTKWLGIDIPRWLHNDLTYSNNILDSSLNACRNIALELIEYAGNKNIPIGFNIESVAIRKEEIEASIELLKDIKGFMG